MYQMLLKVLPANLFGPNHNIHSKVNWRQKLWKIHFSLWYDKEREKSRTPGEYSFMCKYKMH